jgi:hypothetical protein
MEIRNSSNISVFGFKSENTDDILINETDTGDGIQTKNICFFGVGGVCEIRVINARDILMSNVLARNYTHPVSYIQYGIKEIYGSTTTTIEQIEPIAIYKRGNPFWYTRLGPVKDTLIQNAETEYTSVRIYPNPSTGEFIIDHPMEYLEVFNISGKRILQQTASVVDLSGKPEGMYIFRFHDKGRTYFNKVLLVRN